MNVDKDIGLIVMPLTGDVAIVDLGDYELVADFEWRALRVARLVYAVRAVTVGKKCRNIYMHRFLLGLDFGDPRLVDHRDHDGLNNRRSNLRITDAAGNAHNRRTQLGRKYCGVYYAPERNKRLPWFAKIRVGGRSLEVGYFATQEDAARAYDAEAKKRRGEFAYLNFPDE